MFIFSVDGFVAKSVFMVEKTRRADDLDTGKIGLKRFGREYL